VKIAHVSDCYLPRLGGIERQVSDLAMRQHAAGHQVEVITSTAGGRDRGPIRVHRPLIAGEGTIRYSATPRAAALITDAAFDVVHAHLSTWSPLGFFAAREACRAGLPVAVTVHSLWGHATPFWRGTAALAGCREWPVAWTTVSEAAAGYVRRALRPVPVAVLPNGVDPARWTLPAREPRPDRMVIASVMRLAPRKRPRQLVRMLAAVRRAVPRRIRLEAVLVGDGPLRSRVAADLRALQLDWVTLTGALDSAQIRDIYRDADVYVAPATLESFGIAALEARAAGLPVVAQSGTGVAEFVRHGVNGLLVDGDEAMTEALIQLARAPELRAVMGAHNRSHPTPITWDRVLADCAALYEGAAALRGRRPVAAHA
jgi:glycosyltransferase involved in cell wall biosynthesis